MEEQKIDNTKAPTNEKEISVPESTLEKLVRQIEDIKTDNQEKDKKIQRLLDDNQMLKAVADKGRVSRWETQHADFTKKVVRATYNKGKLVVGWRNIEDIVEKLPDKNVWVEKQTVEVIHEDGTKEQMPLLSFGKLQKISGEIVRDEEITEENGEKHRMITLEIDGKKLPSLDVRFVN